MDMLSFFEITPDLVCVAGKDGFFKSVNKAVIDKLEYSRDELFSRPIFSLVHPDDRPITEQTRTEMIEGGRTLVNFENRYITKSGKIIWLYWTSLYITDKELIFAIAKDITEKKRLEKEIHEKYQKFKKLANHFKNNIERDRKYFALELHEELAQLASVIKLDLDSIKKKVTDQSEFVTSRLTHASEIAELLIQKIRKISFKISPHMLEDLGLNETISWICTDFTELIGIPCIFKSEYKENYISHEIKIDFFRICQEAMSNVMNHANATQVNISLTETEDTITLTIIDDGVGFNITKPIVGAGLSVIQDRVASINGRLVIDSKVGRGTYIGVTIDKPRSKENQ